MHTALVTCVDSQPITWLPWSDCSFTDGLTVFRIALSESAELMPTLRGLLVPDELERAARYRRTDDQLRFGCTRGLLRVLLARYTNQPPDRIEFVPGVNQKPELTWPVGWHFNVSHSGNWILIAISRVRVGVDLEWMNPDLAFRDLLPSSFSPAEQRYIDACADARWGFYRLWTRKEALVKATAKGMDDRFGQIPSLTGSHPTDAPLIGGDGHWTVNSFMITDDYPAAVAHEGGGGLIPQFYALDSALLLGF